MEASNSIKSTASDRPRLLHYATLGAVLLAYFHYLCSNRLIAQDEGFYVMAGKMVAAGYAPYLDFFYPQMPLLPYLLGGWIAITDSSWSAARLLPALFNVATGLVIYGHLHRRLGSALAAAGVALFATSTMVISACGTTKTYPFSLLPLVGACAILSGADRVGWRRAAGAGFLLAVATNIRAPLALLLPAFVLRLCAPMSGGRSLSSFLAAFAFGCVPACVFAIADSDAFWFNNLDYHLERAGTGEAADRAAQSKLQVAERVFGLAAGLRLDLLPVPILIYAAAALFVAGLREKRMPEIALTSGLLLVLGNFLPNPTYRQYFVTSDVLLSMGLLVSVSGFLGCYRARKATLAAVCAIVALRLVTTQGMLERYISTGHRVIGISNRTVASWRVATVEKVGREIDSLNGGNGSVMALWPGYLLSSGSLPMPGLENHFAVRFVSKVHPSKEDRERFRLISWRDIMQSVRDREPELIVFFLLDKPSFRSAVKESGYRLASKIENVSIYRRDDNRGEPGDEDVALGDSDGDRESA